MGSRVREDGSGDSRRDGGGGGLCAESPAGAEELAGAEEISCAEEIARRYGNSFGGGWHLDYYYCY